MLIPKAVLFSMALIVSAHPAAAGSVSPEPLQFAQVFSDLPGVTTQEQAEDAKRLKCEQVLVKRHITSLDPVYDTVNSCRRGDGPAFRSMRLPPSIERQLRGFNY